MKPETLMKIEFEISQIDSLLDENAALLKLVHDKKPDMIEAAALGLFLHSFYNGVENIMKFAVKEECGKLPSGVKWHKELLDACFEKHGGQKAMFSEKLKMALDDYLSFRHFIRNTYSFKIRWERMEHLVLGIGTNWRDIKAEIGNFIRQPIGKDTDSAKAAFRLAELGARGGFPVGVDCTVP